MPKNEVQKRRGRLPSIEVVDLFCGIGGLSYGMKSEGLKILAGFDLDWTCQYAYETNNEAKFIYKDIRQVKKEDIIPFYSKKSVRVLAGCAPCQPFSSYAFKNKKKDEDKYNLLYEFGRLVKDVQPESLQLPLSNYSRCWEISSKHFGLKTTMCHTRLFIALIMEYHRLANVWFCWLLALVKLN